MASQQSTHARSSQLHVFPAFSFVNKCQKVDNLYPSVLKLSVLLHVYAEEEGNLSKQI